MLAHRITGSLLAVSLTVLAGCTPGVKVETAPAPPVVIATPMPDVMMSEMTDMEIRSTAGLSWGPLVVPGFPSGAMIAVLHGNPATSGDYTIRLQFPDGYEFPEHWHPGAEHLTVLTGSFHLGMGSVNPGVLHNYGPGDFLFIPKRMSHFGGAKGMTVIQLHGQGPFAINLGAPK